MYQPKNNRRSTNDSDHVDMESHGSLGRSTGLLRNQSIEDMRTNGSQIVHSTASNSIFRHKNTASSKGSTAVNPPAIINPTTSVQHQKIVGNTVDAVVAPFSVHAGQHQLTSQSSLNSTKATL